jgi:hypothetical protein
MPDDKNDEAEREVGVPPHQPYRPDEVDEIDEAAEESFPASDPPSFDGGSRKPAAGT